MARQSRALHSTTLSRADRRTLCHQLNFSLINENAAPEGGTDKKGLVLSLKGSPETSRCCLAEREFGQAPAQPQAGPGKGWLSAVGRGRKVGGIFTCPGERDGASTRNAAPAAHCKVQLGLQLELAALLVCIATVLAPRGVSRALWETRGILRTNQTLYKTKGTFIYRTAAGPVRGPGVCSRQPHPRVPDPPGQEETAPLKKSGEVSQVKGWRRAGERGATSTPCPPCSTGNKGGTRGTHWVFSACSQGTLFTPSTVLCPGKGLAHGCKHSPWPQLTSMGKALPAPIREEELPPPPATEGAMQEK